MKTTNKEIKEKEERLLSFKKEVEVLHDITDAEEYARQLAHLFLGNGLSLRTILLMAIDFGQQHPHWIPVEDELPEDDESVLIYGDSGVDFGSYNSKTKYWLSEYSGQPTHWMPIVPPRKEEDNE